MIDRVWAVVVARAGDGAKSRLAGVLDACERTWLARAMLADVLGVCRDAADVLDGTLVVVDEAARDVAARYTGAIVDDPGGGDMNAAVREGIAVAWRRGATSVIVLPGDLPSMSTADLREIVSAAGGAPRAVVVGVSRDGQGTNALLLRPPDVIAPGFGPPSADRHVAAGSAADALARRISGLGLSRDVDTPADLAGVLDASVGLNTTVALMRLARKRLVGRLASSARR
jgi:2-phospho-L-lactate/phosphoenolpyruvate guanylyltransferase